MFNSSKPPFDNPDLRRALGIALEVPLITSKILKDGYVTARGYVPEGIENYRNAYPPHADTPWAQRREEASVLLAKAGYSDENPLRITLRYIAEE